MSIPLKDPLNLRTPHAIDGLTSDMSVDVVSSIVDRVYRNRKKISDAYDDVLESKSSQ